MSVEFHVGQQIACIDDERWEMETGDRLEKGRIYTIRRVEPYLFDTESGVTDEQVGIWVEEAVRKFPTLRPEGEDGPWVHFRFKPVRKTDISVFTAMLNPTPVKEDA